MTTGAGVSATGATVSVGAAVSGSETIFTAFLRGARGFLVGSASVFSMAGASASADLTARFLRGAGEEVDFRRAGFLGADPSGSNDGFSVGSVITNFFKKLGLGKTQGWPVSILRFHSLWR